MAIRVQSKANLSHVEVISKDDDALDLENSDWEEYTKTGDVSKLKFVEGKQPTRFICNFVISGKESALIKNDMYAGREEDGAPKFAIGSFQQRVTKFTLKEIVNAADIPKEEQWELKKDDRGYVNENTMNKLERYNIVGAVFLLYTNLVLADARQNAKNS